MYHNDTKMNKILLIILVACAVNCCKDDSEKQWKVVFANELLTEEGLLTIMRYETLQRKTGNQVLALIEDLFPDFDFDKQFLRDLISRVTAEAAPANDEFRNPTSDPQAKSKRQARTTQPPHFPPDDVLLNHLVSNESVTALIRYEALRERRPDLIVANLVINLQARVPEARIRYLMERCMTNVTATPVAQARCPRRTATDDAAQRVQVARNNLLRLSNDPSLLSRIIAVDEITVWPGINIIVAYWQNQIIAVGQSPLMVSFNTEHVLNFFEGRLSDAVRENRIRDPVILMDNLNIHQATSVQNAISGRHWTTLEHPVRSPHMNPVDIDLAHRFKTYFDNQFRARHTSDPELITNMIECAVGFITREGTGHSIFNLGALWEHVVTTGGQIPSTQSSHGSGITDSRQIVQVPNATCTLTGQGVFDAAPAKICWADETYHLVRYGCNKGMCWTTKGCSKHPTDGAICPNNRKDFFVIGCKSAADCNPCFPCIRPCITTVY